SESPKTPDVAAGVARVRQLAGQVGDVRPGDGDGNTEKPQKDRKMNGYWMLGDRPERVPKRGHRFSWRCARWVGSGQVHVHTSRYPLYPALSGGRYQNKAISK